MDDISYTAQWTAAARALETERENGRLFNDMYARELAGPFGFGLLKRYNGAGVAEYIAIRTRYMDDATISLLFGEAIGQVVLLASGMDVRPYRLRWPEHATVYELDHISLLAEKRSRLKALGATPMVKVVQVGVDLASDWLPPLRAHGFDTSTASLWVAEGLLFFLTEDQAARLLQTIAAASPERSRLVVDLASAALLRHPMTQGFLKKLRNDGTPWRFGSDDPTGFLKTNGWSVDELKQPGESGAGEGRWAYPVYPAEVRGAPRSWLVRARLDPAFGPTTSISNGELARSTPRRQPQPRFQTERD